MGSLTSLTWEPLQALLTACLRWRPLPSPVSSPISYSWQESIWAWFTAVNPLTSPVLCLPCSDPGDAVLWREHSTAPSSCHPIPKQAAVPCQQHLSAQSSVMSSSCHSQNSEAHQLSLWSPPLTEHICQVYKTDTQLSGLQAWKEKEIAPLQNQEWKQEHSVFLLVNTIINPFQNRENIMPFSKVNFTHRCYVSYTITKIREKKKKKKA